MSEFKVGDRVRILADSCIKGCEADVVEIEQDRVTISCGVFSGCFNKDGLELVNKNKKTPTLDQLEQRIEKLEKCVMGEQNSLEKCANVSNEPKNSQVCKVLSKIKEIISKPSLLTEDERVILRNLDKKWKWIARDKDGGLKIFESKPDKEHDHWSISYYYSFESLCLFRKLFQFIKWTDNEPYNIEELLKGECE